MCDPACAATHLRLRHGVDLLQRVGGRGEGLEGNQLHACRAAVQAHVDTVRPQTPARMRAVPPMAAALPSPHCNQRRHAATTPHRLLPHARFCQGIRMLARPHNQRGARSHSLLPNRSMLDTACCTASTPCASSSAAVTCINTGIPAHTGCWMPAPHQRHSSSSSDRAAPQLRQSSAPPSAARRGAFVQLALPNKGTGFGKTSTAHLEEAVARGRLKQQEAHGCCLCCAWCAAAARAGYGRSRQQGRVSRQQGVNSREESSREACSRQGASRCGVAGQWHVRSSCTGHACTAASSCASTTLQPAH